jgi:hypothetical protein
MDRARANAASFCTCATRRAIANDTMSIKAPTAARIERALFKKEQPRLNSLEAEQTRLMNLLGRLEKDPKFPKAELDDIGAQLDKVRSTIIDEVALMGSALNTEIGKRAADKNFPPQQLATMKEHLARIKDTLGGVIYARFNNLNTKELSSLVEGAIANPKDAAAAAAKRSEADWNLYKR